MSAVVETLADHMAVFNGLPEEVEKARGHVDERLGPEHSDIAYFVKLVLSELFTNAIRHTRSGAPGGQVVVLIEPLDDAVRVDVFDQGSGREPRIVRTREPVALPDPGTPESALADWDPDLSGRGLYLVESLSRTWGVYSHEDGRAVYCEVPHDLPPLPALG